MQAPSIVKTINCKIDGPHTVFKIRVQERTDPATAFYINRRFQEFEELKRELSKIHKDIEDAPFPKKSKLGVSRSEKSQNKRAEKLDAFLKTCFNNKEILQSDVFCKFLQILDAKPVLRIAITEGRDLQEYAEEGVLQPYWQVALCTDKEFTKALPRTVVTDSHSAQNQSTLSWTDEVYEMPLSDDVFGVRLNLYNGKTEEVRASVKIRLGTISVNQPTTHRFPLVSATPGALNLPGDVQLTLMVTNNLEPKSSLSTIEVNDAVKKVKQSQQKHRELLAQERKDEPGGSLHVTLNYTPPIGAWEGPFLVRIIEARDLIGSNLTPYATVSWLNESKSTLVNASQNPQFNQTFQFALKTNDVASSYSMLRFSVWNMVEGKSTLLATTEVALEDVLPLLDSPNVPIEKDMWIPLAYPAAPVVDLLNQSKYAKLMREQGYHPKYPVVLIPGLASSALEVLEGKKDWVGSRVWLSIQKLTKTRVNLLWKKFTDNVNSLGDSITNIFTKKDRDDGSIDKTQVNNWIEHMSLADDCKSDPPGIKVRNVSGTAGITYLEADSVIGKKYTYVSGPLVKNLLEFGYVEKENLFAFPYDWRIPFAYLEARDGYFTTLRKSVEEIVSAQRMPVVIFGHSMGCRITHYFLNWIRNTVGQKWIDNHVHTFVAVGAPWLGAPKILRGTISGELMGMDPFLSNGQAIKLSRTFGSSPSLYPIDSQLFFHDDTKKFIYLRDEKGSKAEYMTEKGGYNTVEQMQMLNKAGAVNQAKLLTEYINDPAFGENKTLGIKHMMLEPPPVKNLVSVYGVDLETQLMYFYAYNHKKKRYDLTNYNGVMPDINIKIKDGVGYETPETVQKCNQSLTGYTTMRSGDGTVPYASLSYCYHWRNKIENLKVIELPQAQHRDIISTIKFFEIFINVVAEKPAQDVKSSKISLSNLTGMVGQLAFGSSGLNLGDALKNSSAVVDLENPSNMSVSVDMPVGDSKQ